MHRLILGLVPGDGLEGDHKNRNRLDNTRGNLRVVTNAQNSQNVKRSRDLPRGVGFHKASGKFRAYSRVPGEDRHVHLGLFATPEAASVAATTHRQEHMPYAVD
jgi:hypothetical protein